MSIQTRDDRLVEAVSPLLSLGLTQLSIQVTLSASLTASALGLAALATAYGVAVLHAVRSASLVNARALKRKDRLTAITLACLASTILLIGVLNLASATLLA